MQKPLKNIAYIDANNLYKGIDTLGWKLDYARFHIFLKEKYGCGQIYFFIGLIPRYSKLYQYLQKCGYTIIFKEITYDRGGKPKGNCDSDLVVQVMKDSYENKFQKAVLVSSDGDYASLVKFLMERKQMEVILSPSNWEKCSFLLRRTTAPIVYLNDKRLLLSQKEKAPDRDGTP